MLFAQGIRPVEGILQFGPRGGDDEPVLKVAVQAQFGVISGEMPGPSGGDEIGEGPTAVQKSVCNLEYWAGIPWEAMHEPVRTFSVDLEQFHHEIAELRGALFEAANLANAAFSSRRA